MINPQWLELPMSRTIFYCPKDVRAIDVRLYIHIQIYILLEKNISYLMDKPQKCSLRKHAYSNILKILPPKNENFQIKNSDIFHISSQNIDRGYSLEPPRRGGSNEYPRSMFLSRNKGNTVKPLLVVPSIKQPTCTCIKQPEESCPKIHRHIFELY